MKILYLRQYFKTPEMAGGTRSFEMAKRLAAAGHEVHVITSRQDIDTVPAAIGLPGVKVSWLTVPYNSRMKYVARLFSFFAFSFAATWHAIFRQSDVILATSTPLTIVLPALVANIVKGTPFGRWNGWPWESGANQCNLRIDRDW